MTFGSATAMGHVVRSVALAVLVGLLAFRVLALWQGSRIGSQPMPADVRVVAHECYDAAADVWLVVGTDGQPGVAGLDDNLDGRTDDLRELGAVHSDDRMIVGGSVSKNQGKRMFSGAFVSCPASAADRVWIAFSGRDGHPRRWVRNEDLMNANESLRN